MPDDRDAAAFCAAEYPDLVRGLSLLVGDGTVAEEIAQEALLRACRNWPKVSRLESPGGWTWRVARNLATSHDRRRRAARRARIRLGQDDVHHDADPGVAVAVRDAVAGLPERQRVAIVLRQVLDLSVAETAERMGVSQDAVRSLAKRASAALRAELGDHLDPAAPEVRDAH